MNTMTEREQIIATRKGQNMTRWYKRDGRPGDRGGGKETAMLRYTEPSILKCPTGRYTFVGRVPAALCTVRPADRNAVMGGRAWRDADGNLYESKPIVRDTRDEIEADLAAWKKGGNR